jgi:hypothetical protein
MMQSLLPTRLLLLKTRRDAEQIKNRKESGTKVCCVGLCVCVCVCCVERMRWRGEESGAVLLSPSASSTPAWHPRPAPPPTPRRWLCHRRPLPAPSLTALSFLPCFRTSTTTLATQPNLRTEFCLNQPSAPTDGPKRERESKRGCKQRETATLAPAPLSLQRRHFRPAPGQAPPPVARAPLALDHGPSRPPLATGIAKTEGSCGRGQPRLLLRPACPTRS